MTKTAKKYHLTQKTVDDCVFEGLSSGAKDIRWDNTISGFGVRVYPSGKKSYVLSYRHEGIKKLMVLGSADKIKFAQAKIIAVKQSAILLDGQDPLQKKKTTNTDLRVEVIFNEYLKNYAQKNIKTWLQIDRAFQKDILPIIGRMDITKLKTQDISKILDTLSKRGSHVTANRIYAYIKAFLNWAVGKGYCDTNPAEKIKRPHKEKARDRILSEGEIKNVWNACEKEGFPFGSFLKFSLLTGQRKGEITEARWEQVDFEKRLWIIPQENTKTGRNQIVPLSDLAWDILMQTPWRDGYIFSIDSKNSYNGFSRSKSRFDALLKEESKTGISHWTIHDLRRTMTTGLAEMGVPPHVCESILNHSSGKISGVAAIYNRYDYLSEKTEALQAWADKLNVLIGRLF